MRREGREEEAEAEGAEGGREEVADVSRLLRALVRIREMKRISLFLFVIAAGSRVEEEEEERAWRVARTRATCSSAARKLRISTVLSRA